MHRQRSLYIGVAIAIALVYMLLLYWFDSRSVYHEHFFDRGVLVWHYQCARLLFIFFFGWLIYAAGAICMLTITGPQGLAKVQARDRYPLGFLIGVAIWSILLYALGLAGLYQMRVAIGITTIVILASIPHLVACLEDAAEAFKRVFMLRSYAPSPASGFDEGRIAVHRSRSLAFRAIGVLLKAWILTAIASALVAFLLVKGLYPGGGHDYYDHYFPYYVRVLETGSILPNDVWYHFYLSKGDGLYFLAMLLTDPLAPQLVSAGFVLCGACVVYALLRPIAPRGLLPWVGVLLYVAFLIYTPGPDYFMARGGWGDLEKEHELTAVLLLGVIWCFIRLYQTSDEEKRLWFLGLHASIVGTIIITLQLGILISFYLSGFMIWFVFNRQWQRAAVAFYGGVTAAVTMIVILAINYDLTGLVLDQAIPFTWPIVNVAKVVQWGALFELLTLDKHMLELSTNAASWPQTILWLVPCFLRLEIWWPLVATASVFAVHRIVSSRVSKNQARSSATFAIWALLWFAGAVAITAIFGGGRSQAVTFYRLSSFSYAPTLCMGLVLWHFGVSEGGCGAVRSTRMALGGVVFATLLTGFVVAGEAAGKLENIDNNVGKIVSNAARLWAGRYSVAEAYQNQQGWPGRTPWGGIYPGVLQAWRVLPPFTRVWSFQIYTYCMLPDCNFQGYLSFIFSPHWRTVYFGRPELARAVLQAEGLNYFFISKEMEIDDPIGRAPLFSPNNIAKYLAIRWTDGTNYLLTWPSSRTQPLDDNFLSAYRSATEKSDTYREFDVKQWKVVADTIAAQEASGGKLHPFPLAWCGNRELCLGALFSRGRP